jgi:hypothetical protein
MHMLDLLLKVDLKFNLQDNFGRTALHVAAA